MIFSTIHTEQLSEWIATARDPSTTDQLAVLDVREEGQFGKGHMLWAVNAPYSRLEMLIAAWIPHPNCPLVLVDQADGVAQRAAKRLHGLGYTDIHILEGGIAGWQASGKELFKGIFVPSKVFGEWVEHRYSTPSLSAEELRARLQARQPTVVLDPRTLAEHAVRHVPGARPCPGGELLRHFHDLVPDSETLVVLACGGRTRGIIAAQTLIEAGVENPVAALADGNHGWRLAGFELDHDPGPKLRAPSHQAHQRGQGYADRLVRKAALASVSPVALKTWLSQPERTTYLLDVRGPESYARRHLHGSRSAPGGQLLQALDRWVAVLGARLVLVDDDGVRAPQVAYWLRVMGWDVHLLEGGIEAAVGAAWQIVHGTPQSTPASALADDAAAVPPLTARAQPLVPEIEALEAARRIREGAAAWVFDSSAAFLRGHPQGSRWANRAHMSVALRQASEGRRLVLFSQAGDSAQLAARDLLEAAEQSNVETVIATVRGGTQAWAQAGLPMSEDSGDLPERMRIDHLAWAANRRNGDLDAMREYLDWERQLVPQLERDGSHFGWLPSDV